MIKEFKEFIMRGNVLDLAVGVVIGGAFTAIVKSIVDGLITPIIAIALVLVTGNKDGKIEGLSVTFYGQKFDFNLVISAIITFLITAFVVFLIVKGVNKLRKPKEEVDIQEEVDQTQEYLREIRDLLATKNNQSNTPDSFK